MIEVTATNLASPLAWGTAAHLAALRDGQTALRHDHYFGLPEPTTAAVFPHQAISAYLTFSDRMIKTVPACSCPRYSRNIRESRSTYAIITNKSVRST